MQIKKYAAILICVLVTASFAYAGSIKSANDFNHKNSGSNGNTTGHVTVDILAAKGVSALTKWTKAKLAAKILASPVDEAVGAAGKGAKTAENILRPGGKLLGEAGTSSKIRILNGSADDAVKLFDELAAGGKPITGTSYPGSMVELPGGGVVKIRPSGTSGNFPTIDIDIPGIGIREIKFKP